MQKIVALIIIAVNIMSFKVYGISARSAVLIDLKSGRVLFEKNAYEKLPMASTTKIMTGLLACESNRLQEDVKVSPFASSTEVCDFGQDKLLIYDIIVSICTSETSFLRFAVCSAETG